jgi:low temperature requirement protein LtrA
VALGESIVAIGVGAQGLPLSVGLIAVAVLGLVLAYFLWWAYFGADDVRAEHALAAIKDPLRRSRAALHAFGYVHVPLLIAIVMAAAGVKKTIGHPGDELGWGAAGLLGGGVALFLLSEVGFQRVLGLASSAWRPAAAAGAAAAIPLGALVNGATQLAVTVAVVALLLSIEGRRAVRAGVVQPYLSAP